MIFDGILIVAIANERIGHAYLYVKNCAIGHQRRDLLMNTLLAQWGKKWRDPIYRLSLVHVPIDRTKCNLS